jgi:hypothetical protein
MRVPVRMTSEILALIERQQQQKVVILKPFSDSHLFSSQQTNKALMQQRRFSIIRF